MEQKQAKKRTKHEQKIVNRLESEVLNELHETSLEIPEKERGKFQKIEIVLGPIDDIDDPVYGEKLLFLQALKKEGVIRDLKKIQKPLKKYKPSALEIAEDPEKWSEHENESDFIPTDLVVVEISAKPHEIIDYYIGLKTNKEERVILTLDRYGNLCKENDRQRCYPLKQTSRRYKILKFLIENQGFQKTMDIRDASGSKDYKTLRSEISKIRSNAKKNLGIDSEGFIESKIGSGYRIGTKFKIKGE